MEQEKINNVRIVFFSGTGGTRKVAECYEAELKRRNVTVGITDLGAGRGERSTEGPAPDDTDLFILLFPVYAFDAPKLVWKWIEGLEADAAGRKIAVISVSGGGEVWPNTGCRNKCCAELEAKGMTVVYDNMMCMPANMLAEVNDHLAIRLIRIIPEKVSVALDDILSGRVKRTHFHKSALRKGLTSLENSNSAKFAKGFTIGEECSGCGWCAENCPTSNIVIGKEASRPEFLDRCTICMRCIYGCPLHAIRSRSGMIFKNGFDLDAVEKRMEGVEPEPVEKCCKGLMFKGVKDYLLNKY